MGYKLRPSGSSRWLECPASLVLSDQVVQEKRMDQIAAYLGSACHELLETCVKAGHAPAVNYIGSKIEVFDEDQMTFPYTVTVDQYMVDTVQFFLDEVGIPAKEVEVHSEINLTHSEIPELQGTADYLAIYGEHAVLADLKSGKGVVQARNRKGEVNTQLLSYACLVFDAYPKLETLTLAIISPNIKTKDKTRTTGINRKDADEHLARVKEASKLADIATPATLDQITKVGSQCFWCVAKNICPTRAKESVERDFGEL
jgi:hypothetical protein